MKTFLFHVICNFNCFSILEQIFEIFFSNKLPKIYNAFFLFSGWESFSNHYQVTKLAHGQLEIVTEQPANNPSVYFTENVWSIFIFKSALITLILVTLFLPLIYWFSLLISYLLVQFWFIYLGNLKIFESKFLNFTLFTRPYWYRLWSVVPVVLYHYSWLFNSFPFYLVFFIPFKLINPWMTGHFVRSLFFTSYKPTALPYTCYCTLTLLLLLLLNYSIVAGLFFAYSASIFIYNWLHRRPKPTGYYYYQFLVYVFRRKTIRYVSFYQLLTQQLYLALYPIFFAFVLFIFVTILLFSMYYTVFFHPITIWNGYFSQTVISFFFTDIAIKTYTKNPILLDYTIGLDGLNLWLIWLTALLTFLCILYLLDTVQLSSFFAQASWLFLLCFASFQFFCVPNYFWMYIYFELSLLPIFTLIIFWGSNWWKVHAAYQMLLFTFIGSIFLLTGILLLYSWVRTFNCFDIFFITRSVELNLIFSDLEKKIIWLLLFIGFAIKTPLYPFHIWLPEAHSEAPTTGSVMLAGVLLKMGTYGFLRFVIPLFPTVLETFWTLVFSTCICGIILSSLAALAQVDIKKIIAYSSISHMGLVIIGSYTCTMNGLLGSCYMMLSHGLISSALFFSIGLLYKIYGTRSLIHYKSLAHFMPRFSLCFFVFSLANMGFPGTAGFPGELLIFSAMSADNFFLSLLVTLGSIFGGVYTIWLLTRLLYGQISFHISTYWDLKSAEWKILQFLVILIILFGVLPFFVLDFLKPTCSFFLTLNSV